MTAPSTLDSESMEHPSSVPKSMAEALSWESPEKALMALSEASEVEARRLSLELMSNLEELMGSLDSSLPSVLLNLPNQMAGNEEKTNPVETAMACADSILASLTKIASGGSEASQEIRELEEEKREMEQHAQDVETALALRNISESVAEALSTQRYDVAAKAIAEYTEQERLERHTQRALAYAGVYTVQQIETNKQVLRKTVLGKYEAAVDQGDLRVLGDLTPLLQMVQLEKEGVALYLRYLQAAMATEWKEASTGAKQTLPYAKMGRVYNCAVQTLRHHMPMVSFCLCKADGDAAVVQLVHVQVEQNVVPLFQAYISDRKLMQLARNAQRIYVLLEERYMSMGGRINFIENEEPDSPTRGATSLAEEVDDCGFSIEVGSLAEVDGSMEEAALCIQHAESYLRFLSHTVSEVNKARELRHKAEAEERRLHRERQEWSTGIHVEDKEEKNYHPIEIIPAHTQLHEVLAEVGGYYSGIERCLLLASMQRAFVQVSSTTPDPRQYSPLGMKGHSTGKDRPGTRALKTSLVETCLYATRRATQRATATGHTGTASAVANFGSDCLGGVLLEVMSRRAEEFGVARLKPGNGLLEGSSGLFGNAVMASANMIRRGAAAGAAAAAVGTAQEDDEATRQRVQLGIACACATLNDLEVAVHHTQQLEKMLTESIERGFPAKSHETEQLLMCVKSFGPVTESFRAASNGAVESLVAVLNSRVRSIVSDAVGADGAASSITSSSFMGSTVMAGGKGVDRSVVRMDYNLDDAAYKLLQLSEGCMARLYVNKTVRWFSPVLHLVPCRPNPHTVLSSVSFCFINAVVSHWMS